MEESTGKFESKESEYEITISFGSQTIARFELSKIASYALFNERQRLRVAQCLKLWNGESDLFPIDNTGNKSAFIEGGTKTFAELLTPPTKGETLTAVSDGVADAIRAAFIDDEPNPINKDCRNVADGLFAIADAIRYVTRPISGR